MTWTEPICKRFSPAEFETYVRGLTITIWKPDFVVLHNTYDPTLTKRIAGCDFWPDFTGETHMRGFVRYYRDELQWHAGPHLFVEPAGIWVFSPLTAPGVHSPSWNGVSWGVEMIGDYSIEELPDAMKTNVAAALAVLHGARGLDPGTLRLHHEDPATTHHDCPGKNIVKADVIQWVRDRLSASGGANT
jgi:hypothetical protein